VALAAEPVVPAAPGPVVVVALDREQAAARLARLPDELHPQVTLVTAAEPRGQGVPPVGRTIEAAVDPTTWRPAADKGSIRRRPGTVGRIARLVTSPRGTVNRRLGRGADAAETLEAATEAVRELAKAQDAGGPIEVIAVDGHDHLAVEPLARAGTIWRSDGGLRRLVDLTEASSRRD
jgi:hypothetical protein